MVGRLSIYIHIYIYINNICVLPSTYCLLPIIDRLVTDTTLDLGITKNEWLQCVKNREVRGLLSELGDQ